MKPLRIGRIFGSPIELEPSLFVMGVVLIVLFRSQFSVVAPDNAVLVAALFVISLFISTFVHELAHVIMLRIYGMRVRSVSLNMIGGRTDVEQPYASALPLFASALAGPVTSAVIGAAALWASSLTGGVLYALLWSIGWVNLLLAVMNIAPGMPLDGGQVVRSIVWAISGKDWLGLKVAGWCGRVVAVLLVAWLLLGIRGFELADAMRGVIALIVGGVMWFGASSALREARVSRKISRLVARKLADSGPAPASSPQISAALEGRQLLVAMAENPAQSYELVDADGEPVGRLDAAVVDKVYRERA